MLLNLLSNALKFTNRNGKINVIVDYNQQEELMFQVTDTGLGIKDEDQGKLFKLFGSIKTNKINTKGIGLGLVIC